MLKKVGNELWGFAKSEANLVKRNFSLNYVLGFFFSIALVVGGFALLTIDTDEAKEMRKPSNEFSENHKVFYSKNHIFITECAK